MSNYFYSDICEICGMSLTGVERSDLEELKREHYLNHRLADIERRLKLLEQKLQRPNKPTPSPYKPKSLPYKYKKYKG